MTKKAIYTLLAALLLTACGKTELPQNDSSPTSSAPEVVEAMTPITEESSPDDDTIPDSSAADSSEDVSSQSDSSSSKNRKKLKKEITLEYAETAEVYSRLPLSEFIKTNAELKDPAALLDTSQLGAVKQTVEVLYKDESFSLEISYNVVDTTAPVCLNPGYGSVLPTGSVFDPDSLVGYADNCDRRPALSCTGYVDTSAEGVYPVTLTVTDASGNSTSWDLDVTVSDQPADNYIDSGDLIGFGDFMQMYAGEGCHFGIDVSKWQGSIDFGAVKGAGCEFAIIRMGYSSDGYIYPDEYFEDNLRNARAAGLKVGVYFYSEDSRADIARGVARYIADTLGGSRLDLPVAFDWEDFYHFQNYGMSIHDLSELFEAFADELDKNGYDTMLYSSKNFLENFWENSGCHPVWVANYTDADNYSGSHILWQRCGNGRINGIDGAVDLNVLYDR